jgi:hypothetical protein
MWSLLNLIKVEAFLGGNVVMSNALVRGLAVTLIVGGVAIANDPCSLNPEEQKNVNQAINQGVAYLKKTQLPSGAWVNANLEVQPWPVGYTALGGLTLVECGVPAADPAIKKAAAFVRQRIPILRGTYEISLAILFLDRLGQSDDRKVIQTLALRLAAGQNPLGGWGYKCPLLQPAQEKKIIKFLGEQRWP